MKKAFKFPSLSSSPYCTLASMIDSVRFRWFCYVRFRYVHFRFRCVHFRFRCVHFRFRYVHFRMRERRSRSFAVWWSVDRSTTWKRSCVANPLHQNQVGFWKIFVYFVNNCFSFPRKIVSGLILAHNFSFYWKTILRSQCFQMCVGLNLHTSCNFKTSFLQNIFFKEDRTFSFILFQSKDPIYTCIYCSSVHFWRAYLGCNTQSNQVFTRYH